ncbi:MAG TPA: hypothetical protein VGG33_04665 [Polyangia bacterium]
MSRPRGTRFSTALSAWALLTTMLASACSGNYSNEDVDFQLALPETDDLTVKLPRQALVTPDAAEYYLATREVVFKVNAFVLAVVGIVDHVRAFAPSERRGNLRVWGPFPHDRDPTFEQRMTMVRVVDAAGPRFDYQIEFRRAGDAQAPWTPLITGLFLPLSPTETRPNQIVLDLVEARRQGYPVSDFNELEELRIAYQRRVPPYRTTMTVRNVKEAQSPGATYNYSENADRSGEMTFAWQVRDNIWVSAVELFSRWISSGAGRADARILEGLAAVAGSRGIDCWGPDARATYLRRDWGDRREEGDPTTCVLPAPPP